MWLLSEKDDLNLKAIGAASTIANVIKVPSETHLLNYSRSRKNDNIDITIPLIQAPFFGILVSGSSYWNILKKRPSFEETYKILY